MRVIFLADIVNDAVAQITEEEGRGCNQKNLLHSLFFRATGTFRTLAILALLSARTRAARLALFARIALVSTRYARFTLLFFLYFIHNVEHSIKNDLQDDAAFFRKFADTRTF